jgi:pectinesterase
MKDEQGKELGTFRTPTVKIEADDFSAENITFENSAGDVGQALAVAVLSDRVVFRNCRFLGWQDTIWDHKGRHYYENCYITGHCDFIFGGGIAFFEKCHIHCLNGSYITAASTPEQESFGYVFSNCQITGEPEKSRTYLGRPWRDYASVIFLNTEMSKIVRPEGWHNWKKPHREKTSRYAEYNSTGDGADPSARVKWSRQLTCEEARAITISTVLSGADGWDPVTGTIRSPK